MLYEAFMPKGPCKITVICHLEDFILELNLGKMRCFALGRPPLHRPYLYSSHMHVGALVAFNCGIVWCREEAIKAAEEQQLAAMEAARKRLAESLAQGRPKSGGRPASAAARPASAAHAGIVRPASAKP